MNKIIDVLCVFCAVIILPNKIYEVKEKTYICRMKIEPIIENIKEVILKHVPARYIFLFGSYAYGNPTEESDIDIYIVTPDDTGNFSELCAKIRGDLSKKKYFLLICY